MPVNQRIKIVIEHERYKQSELANEMGISKQAMSGQLSSAREASLKLILLVLKKFPHINARWLLFDEGEMLLTTEGLNNTISEPKNTYEVNTLKEQLEEKKEQLSLKDEQISKLQDIIYNMTSTSLPEEKRKETGT